MPALITKCLTCGKDYDVVDDERSYYFSSATYPLGSYTSAAIILMLGESILTCPLDPRPTKYRMSPSPMGANMMEGDDRYTTGDETHPSKDEI